MTRGALIGFVIVTAVAVAVMLAVGVDAVIAVFAGLFAGIVTIMPSERPQSVTGAPLGASRCAKLPGDGPPCLVCSDRGHDGAGLVRVR